jgi:transcription elongation factor Elf1
MGVLFCVIRCPFCGRRFRVRSDEIEKLSREGVNCKFCNKRLELVVMDEIDYMRRRGVGV